MTEEVFEDLIVARIASGNVSLAYAGKPLEPGVLGAVQRVLEEFIDECHSLQVCYFGAVMGMDNIKQMLDHVQEGTTPESIGFSLNDFTGPLRPVDLGNKYNEIFSIEGTFQRLQARSLVISIFVEWESATRRRLATLLGVKPDDVNADLMGNWRRLRNWLLHKDGEAEQQYFHAAAGLAQYLEPCPGVPEVSASDVVKLMGLLSSLEIKVSN